MKPYSNGPLVGGEGTKDLDMANSPTKNKQRTSKFIYYCQLNESTQFVVLFLRKQPCMY